MGAARYTRASNWKMHMMTKTSLADARQALIDMLDCVQCILNQNGFLGIDHHCRNNEVPKRLPARTRQHMGLTPMDPHGAVLPRG